MRAKQDLFHLAIPARDLDRTEHFYGKLLGCAIARRYADRITFNFFGDQLVCHLHKEEPVRELRLYPRHFGITFRNHIDFQSLLRLVEIREVPVFQPVTQRFEGKAEEHWTLVLRDPSDNLVEFKYYRDSRMMY